MAKKVKNDEQYSAKHITSLTPKEHLKRKLNLTFGRELGDEDYPFSSQKSVAIRELQDNSVGELIRKFGDRIKVTFYNDGSIEVQDNGRGLPTDTTVDAFGKKVSGFIITLGTLQSGENLGENSSGGKSTSQNGLGASATVALSSRFDIKVFRNKKIYSLSFKDGDPGFFDGDTIDSPFTELKDLEFIKEEKDNRSKEEKAKFPKGTIVRSWLDPKVFSSPYPVDVDDLILRLKGTAFLLPGTYIEIENHLREDENGNVQHETYHFEEGIAQLVEYNSTGNKLSDTIDIKTVGEYQEKNATRYDKKSKAIVHENATRTVDIELSLAYNDSYSYSIDSYVNTIRTRLGGVHVTAFEKALVQAFNERLDSMKSVRTAKDPVPIIEDYKEGLTAVLSVYVTDPLYTSQIKEELSGKEVQKAIQKALYAELSEFANANKNLNTMKIIGEKVMTAARNRQLAQEQKELKREKSRLSSSNNTMPHKLVDCEYTHEPHSELYIVEGDSALGGLKAARDSSFQALLPIRGKMINPLKESKKKVFANQEVQDFIKVLGAGVEENFDLDLARYQRIIIAADADVDGGQIVCLVTLNLYKLFPQLFEAGRVFKTNTPLFVLKPKNKSKKKDEILYAFTNEQFEQIRKRIDLSKYEVTRNKGLGEAGPEVLAETAMNPETRVLTKIVIDDVEKAEKWFNIAMGPDTDVRKTWIESNQIDFAEE